MTQGLAKAWLTSLFLLTHPMWDVTCRQCAFYNPFQISTHTSHARCDDSLKRIDRFHCISTHTSRVGCDTHPVLPTQSGHMISTHTSRVGCDSNVVLPISCILQYFYSHIPCGMWLTYLMVKIGFDDFYSHIPCGMWASPLTSNFFPEIFLLTHPVWDVTLYIVYYSLSIPIYHEMDL